MNVNKVNHYVKLPRVSNRPFTHFKIPHGLHTTMNAGKLVPMYCKEIYPNTRVKLEWRNVVRLLTPKYPTMDIANMDVFFFFVPNIEIWDKCKNFLGENDTDYWTEKKAYTVPQISVPLYEQNSLSNGSSSCRKSVGDLADYLGVPIISTNTQQFSSSPMVSVSALPFRAYVKVWNDWFRDENFQEPCKLTLGDITPTLYPGRLDYEGGDDYVTYAEIGATLCPVDKYKDYFTSLLPQPQKGAPVTLPLTGTIPVIPGTGDPTRNTDKLSPVNFYTSFGTKSPNSDLFIGNLDSVGIHSNLRAVNKSAIAAYGSDVYQYLEADLGNATAVTVEQLRLAFATQRFLEMSALGGTRYVELISYMFGANCPDEYLHRSRFLGGKSIPINITPITQLSGSDTESLGQVGAFSNTVGSDYAFDEKFEEHGFIIGVCCVRTQHSYSQGLPRYFMRKNELDYYFPCFAHLGEQPVYNKEIYVQGTVIDDEIIGYQQAWDEMRHTPVRSSGYLRMGAPGALEQWTYADKFDSLPILGKEFIEETDVNIARTLAVTEYIHQFIVDWAFNEDVYQILPASSTPKLIG